MQVQDKRDSASSTDVRQPFRVLSPNHSKVSADTGSDLFAEIFQSIAAIVSPQPENRTPAAKPSSDQSVDQPASTEEASSAQDEEDEKREEVTAVATPIPSALVQTELKPQAQATKPDEPCVGACQKDESITTDKPKTETSSLNAKVDSKPIVEPVDSPVASETLTNNNAQAAIETPPVADENAPQALRSIDRGGDEQKNALPSDAPETSTAKVQAPSVVEASPDSKLSSEPAAASGSGAVIGNTATDSDSAPRDGRNRRSRGNAAEERTATASTAESAKDRLAAAEPVVSQSTVEQSQAASIDPSMLPATEAVPSAALPAPPSLVTPPVAAMAAAAVSQTISTSAGTATVSRESLSNSTPVIGGVTGTHSDGGETANVQSTPASRQAEVADRARLVHRIAKAFQRMGVDGGQVRLRMHPDDLGSVQLDMQVSGRKVSATVTAESDEAVQLLQGSLPELRQKLESQGLVVERLDVERRAEDEAGGWRGQNQSQNQSGYNGQSSQQDNLWGRATAARANSIVEKSRDSSQNPSVTRSVATVSRSILPGDRPLDLKA